MVLHVGALVVFIDRYSIAHAYPWIVIIFLVIQLLNVFLYPRKKAAIVLLIANVVIIGFWMYWAIYFLVYYLEVRKNPKDNMEGFNLVLAIVNFLIAMVEVGVEAVFVKIFFLLHKTQSTVYF